MSFGERSALGPRRDIEGLETEPHRTSGGPSQHSLPEPPYVLGRLTSQGEPPSLCARGPRSEAVVCHLSGAIWQWGILLVFALDAAAGGRGLLVTRGIRQGCLASGGASPSTAYSLA